RFDWLRPRATQVRRAPVERTSIVDSFWDFFWLILVTFMFVTFLLVLFQIVGDLFADKDLSGGGKALWIIALILFPLLGSLVYLIVRGRAMPERRVAAVAAAKAETEEYIRGVAAAPASPTEEISQAHALLQAGAIDQTEFERLKA